jgi:hypothetical protein
LAGDFSASGVCWDIPTAESKGAQQVGTVNVEQKGTNVGEFLRCNVRYIKLHKIKFYILKAISIFRHSAGNLQTNQIMELLKHSVSQCF